MRVPIDPDVDTELDVIVRSLELNGIQGQMQTDIAKSIQLNLLRLRSKKDLAAINSIDHENHMHVRIG